jgi:acetylornithine deacetylase/succinyl-diaminopimelate desuccinylase-like protein
MEFASIPAPPFGEAERGEWLRAKFAELGLRDCRTDDAGNVLAIFPGGDGERNALALTSHIDTVFPAGTAIEIRRDGERLLGPGISDNASGVTALLALAAAMNSAELRTEAPILFTGTVGEEGEGNLRGMRHLFASDPWKDSIAHTLVVDGAGTETIVKQALGSRRFEVTVRGKGGHSWSDFGDPNPIAVLAQAVSDFYKTQPPAAPRKKSAYNVGVIAGGTSVNSIPESASMRVDLRGESEEEIERLEVALRSAVEEAVKANALGAAGRKLSAEIRKIGDRPAAELAAAARILQVVRAADAHLGIRSRLHVSSTDANIPLSLGKEAVSIGAGGTGGGAHTLNEWFDPAGRDLGLKRILLTVLALARLED